MNTLFNRYPFPVAIGSILGVVVFGLISFWGISSSGGLLPFLVAVVCGLLVALVSGLLIWNYFRCFCALGVCLIPDSWSNHAMMAGLVTHDKGLNSVGRRSEIAVPRKWLKMPKIKDGSIFIPVSTTSGGINKDNADGLAQKLADVMSMSYGRAEFPADKKRGYCVFVLSVDDKTVI